MSEPATTNQIAKTSVPTSVGTFLIGLTIGIGGTLIALRAMDDTPEPGTVVDIVQTSNAPNTAPTGGAGPRPPMPAMIPGGPGIFGPRPKRNLTTAVSKLELLTRAPLHVELEAEQKQKIAELLRKWEQTETMSDDEATAQLEAFNALLTPDQKAVLDSISLPFTRPGGGPGGGATAGATTAGAAPTSGPGPAGGPPSGFGPMGGGDPNENPFRQEQHQKRLQDLSTRLKA